MSFAASAMVAVGLLLAGCSAPTDPDVTGGTTATIADDVFASSPDGEYSNETILLTGAFDPAVADAALRAAGERFMFVDETGVEHATLDEVETALAQGLYTPNYVADPVRTDRGLELYVDAKGWISDPMRIAFRRILAEELAAAGLRDVIVVAASG